MEVQVRFPTIGLSRNTPVMQAVVFEDPSDSRFLSVWPVSQVKKKCTKTFEQFTPSFLNNTNLSHTNEVKRTLVGLWRLLSLLFFLKILDPFCVVPCMEFGGSRKDVLLIREPFEMSFGLVLVVFPHEHELFSYLFKKKSCLINSI